MGKGGRFASFDATAAGAGPSAMPVLRDRATGRILTPNTPHAISTSLFQGTITVVIGDSLSSSGCLAHVVVRGHFLKRLACQQCLTGQSFNRPLRLPSPGSITTTLGLALLRAWSPSLSIRVGDRPHMLTPLLAAASRVLSGSSIVAAASSSAQPPDDDDMHAFAQATDPSAASSSSSLNCRGHRARRRFFSSAASSATDEHLAFDPSVEYSFHFIVRRIDLGTSRLVGLPSLFDLRLDGYLNGQPLRLMCVWHPQHPKAPEFSLDDAVPLWDVEVWTEKEWAEQQAEAPESPELG